MTGQFLGRGFRRVAAEPGQRHLVAVDGLRFGPRSRRQGAAEAGRGRGLALLRAALLWTVLLRPIPWLAPSRTATGRCRTPAAEARRLPAPPFRCRRRGRMPAAAARCRRRPTAVPCRRRPRQRPRGAGGRCLPRPPPARRRSPEEVRRTLRAPGPPEADGVDAAEDAAGGVARPEAEAAPAGSAGLSPGASRACAWSVSKVTVRSMAGFPASAGRPSAPSAGPSFEPPWPRCQAGCRRPAAARVSASAAARACSEKGGSAGSGGLAGVRTTPRLTTTRARHARSA